MKRNIPRGWRFLKPTEKIKEGDRFSYSGFSPGYNGSIVWANGFTRIGSTLAASRDEYREYNKHESNCVVIRRIAKKGGKRK